MDIYEVVKPFYVLSRLVGFSWFALPSHKWKLPKFVDAVLMILNVSLRLYSMCWTYLSSEYTKELTISLVVDQLFLVCSSIAWLFFIALGLWKRQANLGILSGIVNFDRHFIMQIQHARHRRFVWFYSFATVAVIPLASTISYLSYPERAMEKNSVNIMLNSSLFTILYIVSISHILLAAWAVLLRLRMLNKAFEKDCHNYQVITMRSRRVCNVGHYRKLFDLFYNTLEEVNMCFAWVGFFCIVICFLGIIATLFFIYELSQTYSFITTNTMANLFWLVVFNAFVVGIVNINDELKREVIQSKSIWLWWNVKLNILLSFRRSAPAK